LKDIKIERNPLSKVGALGFLLTIFEVQISFLSQIQHRNCRLNHDIIIEERKFCSELGKNSQWPNQCNKADTNFLVKTP
jgi:hypothetical protein